LQEFRRFVTEVRSVESQLFRAAIENFVNRFASVDQRGVIAENFDGGVDAASFKLDECIGEKVLRLEDGDFIEGTGIS